MKISERTLSELGRLITGDSERAPYRTKGQLIRFFSGLSPDLSSIDTSSSRWLYAEECLRSVNGTPAVQRAIEHALHPAEFLDKPFRLDAVVEHFNRFLSYDGYEVQIAGGLTRVRRKAQPQVRVTLQLGDTSVLTQSYIDDQVAKCDSKIAEEDYDGAITNARTLLEAILTAIEHEFGTDIKPYDGDLVKLYKRVQAVLGLEPNRKDVSDTVKQVLSGLSSIVSGLAGLRNKMSDAHVLSYRPARHHAVLAVNAAKTICSFVLETRNYQISRGTLSPTRSDQSRSKPRSAG